MATMGAVPPTKAWAMLYLRAGRRSSHERVSGGTTVAMSLPYGHAAVPHLGHAAGRHPRSQSSAWWWW